MTEEGAKQHGAGRCTNDRGKCKQNQHQVAEENAQGAALRAAMREYRAGFSGWRKVQAPGGPCEGQTGYCERFTWSENRRHARGANPSTGPVRSVVSRTSTRRRAWPTSTQVPPPLPL